MGELDPYSSSLRIARPLRLWKRFPLLNIFSSPPLKERLCRNWPQNRPKQDWLEMFWNRESWDWDTLAYSFHCIFWSISLIIFWKSFFLLQIIVINEPFLKIRLFWLEPQYCSFAVSRLGQSTDTDWKFCENAIIFKRYRLRIWVNSKDRCMENFYKFGSGFDLSSTKSRHKKHLHLNSDNLRYRYMVKG